MQWLTYIGQLFLAHMRQYILIGSNWYQGNMLGAETRDAKDVQG